MIAPVLGSPLGDVIFGHNEKIIEEFRSQGGKPPSWTGTSPLLLVHHRGAKSGSERVTPAAYLPDGGRYVIFASKAGAPDNPAWYHNLKANPDTQIEVGNDTIDVTAEEVTGEERDRLFAQQAERSPQFGEYQEKTERTIPVLVLSPR